MSEPNPEGEKTVAQILQDDLNINVNSLTQVVADLASDVSIRTLLTKLVGEKVEGGGKFISVALSTHLLSEIIVPALIKSVIVPHVLPLPVIGPAIFNLLRSGKSIPGFTLFLRMATVIFLQHMFPGSTTDVVEAIIIVASEELVNIGAEIPVVAEAIDYRF